MAPSEIHHTTNMSRNRRMKSQDEIYARELACDYIYYNKLGKEAYKSNTNAAATLRRIGREVETRHEMVLKNMCDKLDIRTSTAENTFRTVADEIFVSGINWGRIVVLYCFAAEVAVFCSQHEIDIVDDVVTWLSEYVSERKLAEWIKKSGGWVSWRVFTFYNDLKFYASRIETYVKRKWRMNWMNINLYFLCQKCSFLLVFDRNVKWKSFDITKREELIVNFVFPREVLIKAQFFEASNWRWFKLFMNPAGSPTSWRLSHLGFPLIIISKYIC